MTVPDKPSRAVLLLLLHFILILTASAALIYPIGSDHVTADSTPSIPLTEWNALQDLYDSNNGPEWTWPDIGIGVPWNFSNPTNNPCLDDWAGVNCTSETVEGHYFVTVLALPDYGLDGTLPPSVSSFSQLRQLRLGRNSIHGSIPHDLGLLSELRWLSLQGNRFSGTLPVAIGQLANLETLLLHRNHLTGSIPPAYGNLTNLVSIDLGNNRLNGTLPASLCSLSQLKHAIFFFNYLTGTLPSELGGLQSLTNFNVFNNSLHGPVPSGLCAASRLSMLTLGVNQFSHSLPACLASLANLTYIDFFNNSFTGSLPSAWAQMPRLSILYLNKNQLTGRLDLLCSIPTLQQFYVALNRFTGSLPPCLSQLTGLTSAYLYGNSLTGSIPASYSALTQLTYVDWSDNHFTGPLPAFFADCPALSFLYLFGNYFSGTVPVEYSQMASLSLLLLQNNFLTGPIDRIFNATVQQRLNTVQLSGNAFTGRLPAELFSEARCLITFSAVDNCLEDTLSEAICESRTLKLLALDGAGSAKACHRRILPGISSSYVAQHGITGTIPACLFRMANLSILHLSGNRLTGSLPGGSDDSALGPELLDLAISHNLLSGSIPAAVQRRVWYSLDLSYNRLSGTLRSDFNTVPVSNYKRLDRPIITIEVNYTARNHFLSLENNRLSGPIPSTVHDLPKLSILNGNLFTCNWLQNDLPRHDSGRDSYQCGSTAFDAQLYAWLIVLTTSVLSVALLHRYRGRVAAYFQVNEAVEWCNNWLFALQRPVVQSRLKNFKFVVEVADLVGKVALWCTALILLVLVPVYALCTRYYGTIHFQYAWTVSAAFLSGPVPFALQFVLFNALIVFQLYLVQRYKRVYLQITDADEEIRDSEFRRSRAASLSHPAAATQGQVYLAYATFFATNFALVLGVNTLFVYVALYQNSTALAFAQLFLSFFKGFWNSVGSMYLMRWSFNLAASNDTTRADFINTQLFVALFNNIAIPCLVVVAVSPNCFYNAFVAPPAISFRYIYLECAVFVRDQCLLFVPTIASTSFDPPFSYSFDCGAQFITNYAPTFVYLAIEVAFLTPLYLVIPAALFKRATPGTLWYRALDYVVYKALKPLDRQGAEVDSHGRLVRSVYSPFFDANQLLVLVMTYLGLLLTFGVVFPPLAAVLLVAIASTILTNRLVMGRYIYNALQLKDAESAAMGVVDEAGKAEGGDNSGDSINSNNNSSSSRPARSMADQYLEVIELDSRGVGCLHLDKLRTSAWMVTWFCCMFYATFFFDTLGDQQGAAEASWVFILFPLLPVGIYLMIALARPKKRQQWWSFLTGRNVAVSDPVVEVGTELQPVGLGCDGYGAEKGENIFAVNPLMAAGLRGYSGDSGKDGSGRHTTWEEPEKVRGDRETESRSSQGSGSEGSSV